MITTVNKYQLACRVNRNKFWSIKINSASCARAATVYAVVGNKTTGAIQLLDSMVIGVSDIDITRCYKDTKWIVECAICTAIRSIRSNECPRTAEFLDSVIAGVSYIEIS